MFVKLLIASLVILIGVVLVCRRVAKKRNQEMKLRAIVCAGLAAIVLIWWVFYWSNPERDAGSVVLNEAILIKYSIEDYPRYYENWGADGIKRIEAHDRVALEKVSRQKRCDAVYALGLSEFQSTPPDDIVICANCENGNQFYVGPDGNILSERKIH